ncbi:MULTISPECIES: chitooligosaccharide deacetylase NodB [Mesorhizobium]|uniref:chitooligosaccharide deacetylase NodB n=1 Tax=Mesorhizobium TaxID=68287 RepID=UPI0007EDB448|nr:MULTISPECIES: chitooligosaccharide deacetylase NodB [Mesorhizobium]TPJ43733.1 chitooligosaccharide deacetylase NodB [Mesorhizobium sp. B2-6-6]ARP67358.1 chitooligosaccharide deacetylase NodB [Mesorhizobium sp. WSM1497]MCA0002909.1 chitooligosaccharide deacetylase NodB [Mesorhizobium sp. B264B2A]MCA0009195.1 chitooligosaccharide deacetylase NodB [Mesorhizobium sp. B264B1B]MCA0014004.1 chitooligosaccharide deacetylase NodB [Mesorhizobium sp. B294B1A1]
MKHLDRICEMSSHCADGTQERSVYLTFDDGPDPVWTPEVLDVLAQHRTPATFFLIGDAAVDRPELVRRIIADGHEVANHTMTHRDLSRCEPGEVEREIVEANSAIRMACPQAALRYFRAPYGSWTEEALKVSASTGLAPLHWSVDPRDWSRPGADLIVDAVLAGVRPGAIVLLHDGCDCSRRNPRDQTVMALSRLIPALHDRGFTVRPLPQHH